MPDFVHETNAEGKFILTKWASSMDSKSLVLNPNATLLFTDKMSEQLSDLKNP